MTHRTRARRTAALSVGAALALAGVLLPATSAIATPAAPAAADPLRYRIGEVITGGTLGTVAAMRMNEATEVAGVANWPYDAFLWSGGEFTVLPDLPGFERHAAYHLSENGTVVGVADGHDVSYSRAVRWVDGGAPEVLGTLEPSGSSGAYAVNESGMVVGVASVGFGQHAFVWTEEGGMIDITPGAAVDVNESGQVTGERGSKAYVWEDGVLRMLELAPGFAYSHGNRINDLGQVAGNVFTSGGQRIERLARWSPDGEVELLGGAGDDNQVLGINNHGTVVGYGVIGSGYDRGIIYADGVGLRYLDDLLTTSEIKIFSGRSINDQGQILATGLNTYTGEGMTVRLDPVSGPFMHEDAFSVHLRQDGAKAVAKLRVLDEQGKPVRRAKVVAAWYSGAELVEYLGIGCSHHGLGGCRLPRRRDAATRTGQDRPRRQRDGRRQALHHQDHPSEVQLPACRRGNAALCAGHARAVALIGVEPSGAPARDAGTPHERKRLMSHRTYARRTAVLSAGAALALAGALLPAASATATPTTPPAADPLRYRIGEVITGGTLGTVSAMAMNEATEVVGAANYPLDAFRWSGGEFEELPGLPGHIEHIAEDVSDNGTIVGVAGRFAEDNYPRAARWVDGEPEDLGVLEPSGSSHAYGVNESGMVVGDASAGFLSHAFVWTEDEGTIDITNSWGVAYDVNESGQVTGDRGSKAFVWENGHIRMLELAAGFPYSFGNAINDAGQVAGNISTTGGARTSRFARWTPDGEIEVLGGATSENRLFGINNDGTVVGRGVLGSGGYARGVIYADGLGLRYLDDLLTTNEIQIFAGRDINDAGQILASGLNTYTGDGMTVRLDPVSGPFMHEDAFSVRLTQGGAKAVAKLHVLDEQGNPVRRAKVVAAWYDGDRLVEFGVTDKTDPRGRARLTRDASGMGGPKLCITEITHPNFSYVPADGGLPPCAS